MDPSIHRGVHIYGPWSCNQIYPCRSLGLNPNLLRQGSYQKHKAQRLGLKHLPTQLSPLFPKKTGMLLTSLPGRFWDFASGEHTPDLHGNITMLCCTSASFLARSSNVYSTRHQHASSVIRLRALIKRALQLLSRKDGGPCGEEITVLRI